MSLMELIAYFFFALAFIDGIAFLFFVHRHWEEIRGPQDDDDDEDDDEEDENDRDHSMA